MHNVDARWELFPGSTEVLAVTGFYKNFVDPIEPVVALQRLIRQSPWLMGDSASAPTVLHLLRSAASTPAGELRLGAATVSLSGRVQTQFNTTTVDTEPATAFELRRIRLEANVKVNDVVSGRIQPDFAPGNLRADYVLPSRRLKVLSGGVFWPTTTVTSTATTTWARPGSPPARRAPARPVRRTRPGPASRPQR